MAQCKKFRFGKFNLLNGKNVGWLDLNECCLCECGKCVSVRLTESYAHYKRTKEKGEGINNSWQISRCATYTFSDVVGFVFTTVCCCLSHFTAWWSPFCHTHKHIQFHILFLIYSSFLPRQVCELIFLYFFLKSHPFFIIFGHCYSISDNLIPENHAPMQKARYQFCFTVLYIIYTFFSLQTSVLSQSMWDCFACWTRSKTNRISTSQKPETSKQQHTANIHKNTNTHTHINGCMWMYVSWLFVDSVAQSWFGAAFVARMGIF